jgi:hypothetical protein
MLDAEWFALVVLAVAVTIVLTFTVTFLGWVIPSVKRELRKRLMAENLSHALDAELSRLKHDYQKGVCQNFVMEHGFVRSRVRAFLGALNAVLDYEEMGPEYLARFLYSVREVQRPPWVLPPWLLDENWTAPDGKGKVI